MWSRNRGSKIKHLEVETGVVIESTIVWKQKAYTEMYSMSIFNTSFESTSPDNETEFPDKKNSSIKKIYIQETKILKNSNFDSSVKSIGCK